MTHVETQEIERYQHAGEAAERDRGYLMWIRQQPCLICKSGDQQTQTEAHHYGPRAYGTKAPDYQAIPLCRAHHQWPHWEAVHTLGKRWAEYHDIDVDAEIEQLRRDYSSLDCSPVVNPRYTK